MKLFALWFYIKYLFDCNHLNIQFIYTDWNNYKYIVSYNLVGGKSTLQQKSKKQ